jgi:hypothetical protein
LKPRVEWEQAEESRKNALQQRLNDLRALGDVMSADGNYLPLSTSRLVSAKQNPFLLMIAGKKSPPKLA